MKMYRGLIAVLLAATTAGCGLITESSSGEGSKSKMNLQEAADRADSILDNTFAAIKPSVEWTHNQTMAGECTTDRSRSVMTIISPDKQGEFMKLVEDHWKDNGFKHRATSKDGELVHYLTPDGFQLSLKFGWKNQAHFEVTTPCVQESPVDLPTSKYESLDYYGKQRPAPNQKSDYWSSDKE